MNTFSTPIYSRDAKGKTRSWQFEIEGADWRVHSGLLDGNKAVTGWKTCVTMNAGKKNERSPAEQAWAEAHAERDKKLDREYRRTIPELDAVPPSPMLAKKWEDYKAKFTFPCYEQPKLDGIRALISHHGAFSREFQPHNNIEHITDVLMPYLKQRPYLILDGELYNHDLRDDFNTISSVVRTNVNITAEDRQRARDLIQFHIYDVIAPNDFGTRATIVHGLCEEIKHPSIVWVPTNRVLDHDGLDSLYGMWMENGYEGQMVRADDGGYEASKRSKTLLKRKDFETDEFELVDIEEGVGNWAGYAKRVIIKLPNGKTQGGGMRGNQAFTKKLLAEKERYIGSPVTIRYFGFTPDGKARFPVAVDFHPGGRRD